MPGPLFIEVRLPGFGTVTGRHTRGVPGARIDGVLESTRIDPDGVSHTLLAIVRGLSPSQVQSLLADLKETYGEPAELLDGAPGGEAFVRYSIALRDLESPALRAMARFQRAMGVPWMRAEAGEVLLFGEAAGAERARRAAERVERYLADHGVPGQVAVRTPAAEDLQMHSRLLAQLGKVTWGEADPAPARNRT